MTAENTVQRFLDTLSSKEPVPGGGGASALAGALGSALGQMVSNLTIGKKKYAEHEETVKKCLKDLEMLKEAFLELADEDARVFAPLAACYRLPSETPEEKAQKEQVMEEKLLDASLVPLTIMEKSMDTLLILEILAEKGSHLAVSDVGVGVQMTRACLMGAVMNVYINTKSMKNRAKAEEINRQAKAWLEKGSKEADRIYTRVLSELEN